MDGSIGEDWTVSLNLVPVAMKALLGAGPALKVFGTDYGLDDIVTSAWNWHSLTAGG